MKSLLNALQEGRFVELPEGGKEAALHFLATLIEAIPDLNPGTDVAEAVLAREAQFSTGMGMGWACPHMRTSHDGQLLCAAGWSPAGIDYGASDQKPVHFIAMYFVPDCQKHVYLKEISSLAKAVQKARPNEDVTPVQTLADARGHVLDLVSSAVEAQMSEAKVRMIHLEVKQAATEVPSGAVSQSVLALPNVIVPLSILVVPGTKPVLLSQDQDVISRVESAGDLSAALAAQTTFDRGGYRILIRAVTSYQARRLLYDCLAVKLDSSA